MSIQHITSVVRPATDRVALGSLIRSEYVSFLDGMRKSVASAVRIGRALVEVKESLGHGEWLPWLEKNVSFTRQQAARYMKMATDPAPGTLEERMLETVQDVPESPVVPVQMEHCVPFELEKPLENAVSVPEAPSVPEDVPEDDDEQESEPPGPEPSNVKATVTIPEKPPGPFDDLRAAFTAAFKKFNSALNAGDAPAARLVLVAKAAGVILWSNQEKRWELQSTRGLPFLLTLAGSDTRLPSDSNIKLKYEEASGGWVPPAVAFVRKKRERRGVE